MPVAPIISAETDQYLTVPDGDAADSPAGANRDAAHCTAWLRLDRHDQLPYLILTMEDGGESS